MPEANNISSCEISASISQDFWVILSHISILFFDILSFITLGNYFWILIHLKSVHRNIRSINLTIAAGYFLRNVYTTYRSGQKVFLAFFATNACSFQDNSIKCSIESILGRAPVYLTLIASNVAVAERFMATLCYTSYERYNYFFISIAIGLFPWVYQGLTVPSTILEALKKPSTMMIYCNSITSIGLNWDLFISNITILTSAALIISIIIVVVNKRIKKFSSRLSGGRHVRVEFQRKENLEHTKIIAVQIIGLLLTYFLNAAIAMLIANPNITTNLVIKKEFGSLCFPIYASVHVFLALWVSSSLRTKYFSTTFMKKLIGCCVFKRCFKVKIAPLGSPEDYFKYYQSQWS